MLESPFQVLLLQIVLILIMARVCGRLLRLLGQPQVVGEMFAGIVLGPSVLGRFYGGHLLEAIFPEASRGNLEIFAQMGVILFMFMVGLELDLGRLARQGKAVLLTGAASMVAPFVLGGIMAACLIPMGYGPGDKGSQLGFILFLATALSITAFPVLARILTERNLHRTQVGMIAIGCAALNDIGGWCLLAVVFALAEAGGSALHIVLQAGFVVGLAAAYLAAMILLFRPVLARLQALFDVRGYLTADILAIVFMMLTLSSFITDKIGIHALFGAFMLGAVMPSEPRFVAHLTDKLEDIATLFLLPLFFAYTGLHTDLSLISGGRAWAIAGIITLVATVGKIGGTLSTARTTGLSGRQSLTLGVLMNTRGLMELIILNLALSVHAIEFRIFSMMVVMTLVTTMMTTPLIRLLYPKDKRRAEMADGEPFEPAGPQVVISVARPDRVRSLVRIGAMLLGKNPAGQLWALHIDRAEDHENRAAQADPLEIAKDAAKAFGENAGTPVALQTVNVIGDRFHEEILDLARRRKAMWIVLGWHKPIFDHSVLGGTTGAVMRHAHTAVAVLVDKGLAEIHRVMVPYLGDPQDAGALAAADLLSKQPNVEVTILHLVSAERRKVSPLGVSNQMDQQLGKSGNSNVHLQVVETSSPIDKVIEESHRYDLMVLGLSEAWQWGGGWLTAKQESVAQQSRCSLLIVRAAPLKAAGGERPAEAK